MFVTSCAALTVGNEALFVALLSLSVKLLSQPASPVQLFEVNDALVREIWKLQGDLLCVSMALRPHVIHERGVLSPFILVLCYCNVIQSILKDLQTCFNYLEFGDFGCVFCIVSHERGFLLPLTLILYMSYEVFTGSMSSGATVFFSLHSVMLDQVWGGTLTKSSQSRPELWSSGLTAPPPRSPLLNWPHSGI